MPFFASPTSAHLINSDPAKSIVSYWGHPKANAIYSNFYCNYLNSEPASFETNSPTAN